MNILPQKTLFSSKNYFNEEIIGMGIGELHLAKLSR